MKIHPTKTACLIALALAAATLWGCSSHTTVLNQGQGTMIVPVTDTRSDADIEKLLPAEAFAQTEFPKPYVMGFMRICLNEQLTKKGIAYQAGKADQWCSCITDKRVHRFTLREQLDAATAKWDPKVVPDAMKKWNDLTAECIQTTLK